MKIRSGFVSNSSSSSFVLGIPKNHVFKLEDIESSNLQEVLDRPYFEYNGEKFNPSDSQVVAKDRYSMEKMFDKQFDQWRINLNFADVVYAIKHSKKQLMVVDLAYDDDELRDYISKEKKIDILWCFDPENQTESETSSFNLRRS